MNKFKWFFIWAFVFVFFLIFSEYYLRYRGYQVNDDHISFKRYVYECLRPFRPSLPKGSPERPLRALVLGCSFTYGDGVSDEETYVWKLNQLFPNCYFENAGARGWGTVTSLFREEKALNEKKYDLVILSLISNHLYRENFFTCEVLPEGYTKQYNYNIKEDADEFCRLEGDNGSRYMIGRFKGRIWPFDNKSCLINFLRIAYVNYDTVVNDTSLSNDNFIDEHRKRLAIMIRAIQTRAHDHGAKFGVVGLYGFGYKNILDHDHDPNTIEYYVRMPLWENDKNEKCPVVNADYPVIDYRKRTSLRCKPCEADIKATHPGEFIHSYYAETIARWIRQEHLLEKD